MARITYFLGQSTTVVESFTFYGKGTKFTMLILILGALLLIHALGGVWATTQPEWKEEDKEISNADVWSRVGGGVHENEDEVKAPPKTKKDAPSLMLVNRVGSHPPSCRSKCGRCRPCTPVHVPIHPGLNRPFEYYPEAWRCKCRNRLYMP